MLITIILKGGSDSGWYSPPKGTHSGKKHRAVGSGKSVVGKKGLHVVRLASGFAEQKRGPGGLVYYQSDKGAQFPSSITGMDRGKILYNPNTGTLYAVTPSDKMDIEGGMLHALLADAIGTPWQEFDSYVRPWIEEGEVGFDFRQAGVTPGISGRTDIKAAERNMVRAAKAMVRAGFDPDQNVAWTVAYKPERLVTINIKLGQI